jgi:predicted N-acetyltransferase YhbS
VPIPITIRAAQPSDAATISELLGQLGYPAAAADIPDRLTRLAEHRHAVVLVAVDGEDVVGVITSHAYPSLHSATPVAYLTSLVVAESHRGKSIGSQLTARVEEWAREHGSARVVVA